MQRDRFWNAGHGFATADSFIVGWRTTVPRIYEVQLKRCAHAAGKVVCDEFLEAKKPASKLKKCSR